MKSRIKGFDVPHKGIRNGLGKLILSAGNTDYSDVNAVENLYQLGSEIFTILTTHAHDENDITLRELEKKVPGASDHDIEEHERIEQEQAVLENLLSEILEDIRAGKAPYEKGSDFYTGLCDFTSMYYWHMAGEEKETQELIWQHFTDEEILEHRKEIIAGLKPEVLLLWIKYIVPAQSHPERTGFLKGMKANAPEEFFDQVMSVAKDNLYEEEFSMLCDALDYNNISIPPQL